MRTIPSDVLGFLMAAATLMGCGSRGEIWLVEVDTTKGDGYVCSNGYQTNFKGSLAAGGGADSGPVTESSESIGSNILFYAKVVDLDNGQRSLNSGSLLLPGEDLGDGKWSFQWTEVSSDTDTLTHTGGYSLEETERATNTTTLVLTFKGGSATGDMTVESGDSYEVQESDKWAEDAAAYVGSNGTLSWATNTGWESNRYDTAECDGGTCSSLSTSVCSASAPASAVRTDLGKQEDFASLVSLQQYGSFKTSSSSSWSGGWDSGF